MEQQIIMNQELTPEDPQYIEEMAKKGESALQAGNTHREQQDAPSVPKKFMTDDGQVNVDALLKSYQELEKKMSQPKTQPQEESQEVPATQDKPTEETTQEQAKEIVENKGIDFDNLTKEFSTNGQLSEKSYKELADKGIPKETVDAYIQGQMALAEKYQSDVVKSVGGNEAYNQMTEWAKTNLTQGQLEAYNAAVSSSNMDTVSLAVQGLKAQYDRANGSAPQRQLMGATNSSGEAIQPFRSRTQYVDAIKDARYERDPAYRADVLARLERSDIF